MKIIINSISYNTSLVDGPGIRSLIFFQGCDIHCPGCHNSSTWDIRKGTSYEIKDLIEEIHKNSLNKKITITGGEPLLQKEALIELIHGLEGYDIALYTGHLEEDVPTEILSKIKYLKTGPFIQKMKTTIEPFVGSSNQKFKRVG